MRKVIFFLLTAVFLVANPAYSELIYLKSGKKIKGQIIEKDDKKIKVNISGVKITYYNEEIEKIEADTGSTSTVEAAAKPTLPAPVVIAPVEVKNEENIVPVQPTVVKPVVNEVQTPVAGAKNDLILDLIQVSGTRDTMSQMFDQIVEQATEEEKPTLRNILNIDEIITRLIPIYDKYFTEKELQELIAFYNSSTGKKLIEVMPAIMEDSMSASMEYFQEKMPAPEGKK